MVNRLEAAPVQLEGLGYTVKEAGNYLPGEFSMLDNVEYKEGGLKGRRDIKSVPYPAGFQTMAWPFAGNHWFSTAYEIIGFFNEWAITTAFCNGTERQLAVSSTGEAQLMWNPSNFLYVTEDPATGGFGKLQKFFKYNNRNWWLSQSNFHQTLGGINFRLVHCAEKVNDIPSNYVYADLTHSNIVSIPSTDARVIDFEYQDSFIHKNRFWLVSNDTIWYSRATDPTDFTNGGFINFPDSYINAVIPLGDSIYIICKDSIQVLTYQVNPDVDATLRTISSVVGGLHGTVFRDTPVFINNEGIFTISNNNVTKILDNKFDTGSNDYTKQKLTAWREYLIINKGYYDTKALGASATRSNLWPYSTSYDVAGSVNPFTLTDFSVNFWTDARTDVGAGNAFQGTKVHRITRGPQGTSTGLCRTNEVIVDGLNPSIKYTFSMYVRSDTPDKLKTKLLYRGNVEGVAFSSVEVSSTAVSQWTRISATLEGYSSYRIQLEFRNTTDTLIPKPNTIDLDAILLEATSTLRPFFDGNTPSTFTTTASWAGTAEASVSTLVTLAKANVALGQYPSYRYDDAQNKGQTKRTNTIFYNVDEGSVHSVSLVKDDETYNQYILDIAFNPLLNVNGESTLFLLAGNSSLNVRNAFYYMTNEYANSPVDVLLDLTKVFTGDFLKRPYVYFWPKYCVEVSGFMPDNNEYTVKKFRNMELMGTMSSLGMKFAAIYDGDTSEVAGTPVEFGTTGYTSRPHNALRVGLNQRARSLLIKLYNDKNFDPTNISVMFEKFEISAYQVLWTPTNRGPLRAKI